MRCCGSGRKSPTISMTCTVHIWDAWADENGSIGKAYGYQLGVKHQYKEGDDGSGGPCNL